MSTTISGSTGISASATSFLVGQVCTFAMATPPAGFIKANGAAVSRITYASLFTAIGTMYGVGDGSTTFNVPDLRGEFIRGWDDARSIDSGRALGTAQADDFKSHFHTQFAENFPLSSGSSTIMSRGTSGAGGVTSATGGAETRPRNVALMVAIFTGV